MKFSARPGMRRLKGELYENGGATHQDQYDLRARQKTGGTLYLHNLRCSKLFLELLKFFCFFGPVQTILTSYQSQVQVLEQLITTLAPNSSAINIVTKQNKKLNTMAY